MITQVAVLLFPLLMAFAASSDLFTMRISNRLVVLVASSFFALALLAHLPLPDIGLHIACGAVVLVAGFTFFAFGWIGGGDAKLAAAIALWFGFGDSLNYLLDAALLGGLLTVMLLSVRRFPLPRPMARVRWIDRLHDAKTGVPYGIALAAAGILTYSDTALFQRLAS